MTARTKSICAALTVLALPAILAPVTLAAASAPESASTPMGGIATSIQGEAGARRVFLNATRLEEDGDIDGALSEFDFLVQQFPRSVWAPAALLQVALIHLRRGNGIAASQATRQLVETYPTTPSAAGGVVVQTDVQIAGARSFGDLGRARDTLRRIPLQFPPSRFPVLDWRTAAKIRAGEVALLVDEIDEAGGLFIDAMENEPRSSWTARAGVGFADAMLRSGDWRAAAQALQEVIDDFATNEGRVAIDAVGGARRRLTLIHRMVIRTQSGQLPWRRAGTLRMTGLTVENPVGVAADEHGRLIVVDERNSVVAVVGTAREVLARETIKDARHPWWDRSGEAYVVARRSVNHLVPRERSTFTAPKGSRPEPLDNMLAGQRGLFGEWFLLDGDDRRFLVFRPEGAHTRTILERSRELVDLAQDSRGRLYLLDRRQNEVLRFNADGSQDGRVASGQWDRPEAVAVDLLGNVYVLDRDAKTLTVFDGRGARIASVGPTLPGGVELRSPRDVAVDGSGRVYIADRSLSSIVLLE